jgi:predicted ABC-type ATPase
MPNLYVIAGCNGAGKTTASFTVLPEMLNCDEFINADEIAKGLSPFNPNKAAIEAGRIMLSNIQKNLKNGLDFAFETTLSTKSYKNMISQARTLGYKVTLLFFWLESVDLAIERVIKRVSEGGHDIPMPVIRRRYYAGIKNLFEIYIPITDYWLIIDNSQVESEIICEGTFNYWLEIKNNAIFDKIKGQIDNDKRH